MALCCLSRFYLLGCMLVAMFSMPALSAEPPAALIETAERFSKGRALFAEHFAFTRISVAEGLGGPAKEAASGGWKYMTADSKGNFYIAEPQNAQVHWIDTEGVDRIIAGDGKKGFRDGPADQARFDFGIGSYEDLAMACDNEGTVYVSDFMNRRLRKLSRKPDGIWYVSTVSGGGSLMPKKGEWVKATDLEFGCASKFAVNSDATAGYYATSGGIYKVLLKKNKATLLVAASELETAGVKDYSSPHTGGAHITDKGVFYWMPGGSIIWRFDERAGKIERFSGGGPRRSDGIGLLDSGFHTVHVVYSSDASLIYTGGGDEFNVRRIHKGNVTHLLQDGTFGRREGTGHKKDAWKLGSVRYLDSKDRLYAVPAPYQWPRWIVRVTFSKE